jgi:DNA-binding IclR family transcriptional regulator
MRSRDRLAGQGRTPAEGVKSAERVLDLIELLTGEHRGLTFLEITAALGWPKSSSHALVQTMARRGYLSLDETTRRYTLSVDLERVTPSAVVRNGPGQSAAGGA